MRRHSTPHTARAAGSSCAATSSANASVKLRNCSSVRVCDACAKLHRKCCTVAASDSNALRPSSSNDVVADSYTWARFSAFAWQCAQSRQRHGTVARVPGRRAQWQEYQIITSWWCAGSTYLLEFARSDLFEAVTCRETLKLLVISPWVLHLQKFDLFPGFVHDCYSK